MLNKIYANPDPDNVVSRPVRIAPSRVAANVLHREAATGGPKDPFGLG
jgi:hypothetical protein